MKSILAWLTFVTCVFSAIRGVKHAFRMTVSPKYRAKVKEEREAEEDDEIYGTE